MAATKTTKTPAPEKVSLALSEFTEGGGLFPEGRYRIDEAVFNSFNYDGKGPETLTMRLKAQSLDSPSTPAVTQQYSLGKQAAQIYEPDPATGGHSLIKKANLTPDLANKKGLTKGSNFHQFLTNAINAGLSEADWQGDTSIFEGAEAYFTHIKLKEYDDSSKGLTGETSQPKERKYDKTLAVPTRDWTPAGERRSGAAASKVNGKVVTAAAVDDDVIAQLADDLTKLLVVNTDGMARGKARLSIFQAHKAAGIPKSTSDAVINAFLDDNVLGGVLGDLGFALVGSNIEPA